MFRKMPFVLLVIILLVSLLSPWIPIYYQSFFYGLSLTIKSLIVFMLPFIVFGLLFKTAVHFSNKASKMIFLILIAVCCSNFLSTMLSYAVGTFAYQFDLSMSMPTETSALLPGWHLTLPKLFANDIAMFSGLFLGMILGWMYPLFAKKISINLEKIINVILKGLVCIIPIFIAGLVIKMQHDQVMEGIFKNYALIFGLIASAVFAYIAMIYLAVNFGNGKDFGRSLRNMLPAAIAGFGSMSSAASMPLTIIGTEKNSRNPDIARSVIPATVNIHLIGDCFAIPIFAFAVMKGFGMEEPAFVNYAIFAAFFVLAKFSVAAVPGGGILVMLPILETHLGFNAEMLSLMTALYILFDPVITCANVLGNGGFAMGIDRVMTSKAILAQS